MRSAKSAPRTLTAAVTCRRTDPETMLGIFLRLEAALS